MSHASLTRPDINAWCSLRILPERENPRSTSTLPCDNVSTALIILARKRIDEENVNEHRDEALENSGSGSMMVVNQPLLNKFITFVNQLLVKVEITIYRDLTHLC